MNGDFCALLIFVPDEFIATVMKNECNLNFSGTKIEHTDSVIPLNLDKTYYFKEISSSGKKASQANWVG